MTMHDHDNDTDHDQWEWDGEWKRVDEERQQETITDCRINPREILEPVVEEVTFIEPGEWIARTKRSVLRDVMVNLYLEGYRVGEIVMVADDTIVFEVIEEAGLEDREDGERTLECWEIDLNNLDDDESFTVTDLTRTQQRKMLRYIEEHGINGVAYRVYSDGERVQTGEVNAS